MLPPRKRRMPIFTKGHLPVSLAVPAKPNRFQAMEGTMRATLRKDSFLLSSYIRTVAFSSSNLGQVRNKTLYRYRI